MQTHYWGEEEWVEEIIAKEEQNPSKLHALQQIQIEAVAIAEGQHHLQEEVHGNFTSVGTSTPKMSESEADSKRWVRPRTNYRSPQISQSQVII